MILSQIAETVKTTKKMLSKTAPLRVSKKLIPENIFQFLTNKCAYFFRLSKESF